MSSKNRRTAATSRRGSTTDNVAPSSGLTEQADDENVLKALLCKKKSFSEISVVGAAQEQQIVRYDHEKLSDMRVLLAPLSRGSIFRRGCIWWQISFYIGLACVIAALFVFLLKAPARINPDAVSRVSTYFNTFLPFLFGIYLNNIFTRWWAMRTQGVGGIQNALNSMIVILSSQLRGPQHMETKKLLLRYGLLVHEFVYRVARKTDNNLDDLIETRFLAPVECGIIQELPGGAARAQAVWVWIQVLWDGLYKKKCIPWHVHQVILHHISDGRLATKTIFTHLNTQIPFAYVHLMACLVHFNLLILSLQGGMIIAKAVGMLMMAKQTTGQKQAAAADTEACSSLVAQLFYLTMVPMLYLGFMALSQEISDPFGSDPNDFPRAQFHNIMQDECETFIRMAEAIPPAVFEAVLKPDSDSCTGSDTEDPAGEAPPTGEDNV